METEFELFLLIVVLGAVFMVYVVEVLVPVFPPLNWFIPFKLRNPPVRTNPIPFLFVDMIRVFPVLDKLPERVTGVDLTLFCRDVRAVEFRTTVYGLDET